MYVTVNARFDRSIRASYTQTEVVDHVDDLHHDLIREALKMVGITNGVEVTTIADIPPGIGLGSSSSLTVGLRSRSRTPAWRALRLIAAGRGRRRARRPSTACPSFVRLPPAAGCWDSSCSSSRASAGMRGRSSVGRGCRLQRRADAPHPLDGMVGQAERFFSAVTSNRIA
ncbi:MAG: hypothetical protein KJ066_14025 [Acidobacteria bacterium]|nr:hypothetical protein [Acidobacteriota bacterium]